MRIRQSQRRAGLYVAVLLTATIVAVIGLSGLTVARLQFRSSEGGNSVTAARLCARSAVELGMHTVANDPSWRTTYTHDAWTAPQAFGGGTIAWKLFDHLYGDLTADYSSPVWLYGKGTVGNAVRIYGVLIQPPDTSALNLLQNPGMESGASGWFGHGCTVAQHTADCHSGRKSLVAKNRWAYWSGPYQDVTAAIEIGTDYYIECWVKMTGGTYPTRIVMWVGEEWPWEGYTGQWLTGDNIYAGTATWTRITATLTPTWGGSLNAAYVKVDTASGSADFYVDDFLMKVADSGPAAVPLAGTWRPVVE